MAMKKAANELSESDKLFIFEFCREAMSYREILEQILDLMDVSTLEAKGVAERLNRFMGEKK